MTVPLTSVLNMAPPRLRIPMDPNRAANQMPEIRASSTCTESAVVPTRSAAAGWRPPRAHSRQGCHVQKRARFWPKSPPLHWRCISDALRARLRGGHAVGISVFAPRRVASRSVAVAIGGGAAAAFVLARHRLARFPCRGRPRGVDPDGFGRRGFGPGHDRLCRFGLGRPRGRSSLAILIGGASRFTGSILAASIFGASALTCGA